MPPLALTLYRRGTRLGGIQAGGGGPQPLAGRVNIASSAEAVLSAGMRGKMPISSSAKASTLDVTGGWTLVPFTAANGSDWPSPFVEKATVSGASATIQGNRGQIVVPALADYAALHAEGFTPASQNFEVVWDAVMNFTTGAQFQNFMWRVTNPNFGGQYRVTIGVADFDGVTQYISVDEVDPSFVFANKGGQGGLAWAINDIYHFRIRANGSDHKVRWWEDGDPEPSTWNVEFTDSTYATGDIYLASQGGPTAAVRTHLYDNFGYIYL